MDLPTFARYTWPVVYVSANDFRGVQSIVASGLVDFPLIHCDECLPK